ncbi:hypothetical protein LHL20_20615 [Alteromonas sp. McT4-15]|uniref:hypothetical protein n=1 Tax=Alteromonas sp. McT4-15 TaxID=2881256 RepID=UPI001CF8AC0F|nr:hypothetical protein [Alteromonas sp. McT4-15]MCB4438626.1 hypothetical protein [Alteromonas sp. McT4-15]
MDLYIGKGIDSLLFGVTENEAQKLLGSPDKSYFTDSGCKRIQYNELEIELSFEPDSDNRLGWLEVHNKEAKLFGSSLIGLSEKTAVELLSSMLNSKPKYDDFGGFTSINYEDEWLELQVQFGIVKCINFGVLFRENGAPSWPRT